LIIAALCVPQLPEHLQVPVCGSSSSKTRKRYFVAPCQRMKMKMKLKTDEDEVEDRWTNVAPELMDPAVKKLKK
jgi:hypothetical protein